MKVINLLRKRMLDLIKQKLNETIHPSKGVEIVDVQNTMSSKQAQEDPNMEIIANVLDKLWIVDSTLEKEEKDEEPF